MSVDWDLLNCGRQQLPIVWRFSTKIVININIPYKTKNEMNFLQIPRRANMRGRKSGKYNYPNLGIRLTNRYPTILKSIKIIFLRNLACFCTFVFARAIINTKSHFYERYAYSDDFYEFELLYLNKQVMDIYILGLVLKLSTVKSIRFCKWWQKNSIWHNFCRYVYIFILHMSI